MYRPGEGGEDLGHFFISPIAHRNQNRIKFLSSFFFFFSLFWPPCGIWRSLARDQIRATVATYVRAVAMLDLGPPCWAGD